VATILERQYAVERRNRLISTVLGFKVYKYLSLKFGEYASKEATRKLEAIMDQIEQGKADYKEILKNSTKKSWRLRKFEKQINGEQNAGIYPLLATRPHRCQMEKSA